MHQPKGEGYGEGEGEEEVSDLIFISDCFVIVLKCEFGYAWMDNTTRANTTHLFHPLKPLIQKYKVTTRSIIPHILTNSSLQHPIPLLQQPILILKIHVLP